MIKTVRSYAKTPYILLCGLTIVLMLIPQVLVSPYIISILTLANLYAVFAASWDLVSGYTGQLNLGQALFIGIGGYSVGLYADSLGYPMATALGVLVAIIFAFIVAVPCLKLKGPFLSLTTLVVPLIMERLAYTYRDYTGGEYGLMVHTAINRTELYYLTVILMFLSVLVMLIIAHSRFGKVFLAIRENELGVAAAGNNVAYYKILAFIISAVLTALAGCFLAIYLRHIGPGSFAMWTSLNIVIMGIIGGMGTIIGPVFGAYGLSILAEYLRVLGEYDDLIYAVMLVLAVLLFPKGLAGIKTALNKYDLSEGRGKFGKYLGGQGRKQEFRRNTSSE